MRCHFCGAPNTNRLTCPLNEKAKKKDFSKHNTEAKNPAKVLLYCHGETFGLDPLQQKQIRRCCKILNLAYPKKMDSINIKEEVKPTILSTDGNLPAENFNSFNIVVDYACDYSGLTLPGQFDKFTKPLYNNMIQALTPEAWCLTTTYLTPWPSEPEDSKINKRIIQCTNQRLDFIKELLMQKFGSFEVLDIHDKMNSIIFHKAF